MKSLLINCKMILKLKIKKIMSFSFRVQNKKLLKKNKIN